MRDKPRHHRADLVRIATRAMSERGLEPEFPALVERQLAGINGPAHEAGAAIRDLTGLPWCSIDNDDSLDLDQLTACEVLAQGALKLWVAIADVDALVKKGSAIDEHARLNTTSVYTSARIFPMLPERLSTDLTSLNFDAERLALVTEMLFNADATLASSTLYRARVRNRPSWPTTPSAPGSTARPPCQRRQRRCPAWRHNCARRTRSPRPCARTAIRPARWSSKPSSRAPCLTASR